MDGKCIFVTGGVRSGKSAFAEMYVKRHKKDCQPIYIASGVPFDEEMKKRIDRHRQDRRHDGWLTLEVPATFPHEFEQLHGGQIVLWDCLTTWLTNVLVEGLPVEDTLSGLKWQLADWRNKGMTVVLVSNEVLDAGVSDYEFTKNYQQQLGELNQWLVAFCNEAYELDYGLVKRWKG